MTDWAREHRVVVVGAGAVGTSVALTLSAQGAEVLLADRDSAAVAAAVRKGAGTALTDPPGRPADLAVLAVPSAAVARTLLEAQRRGLARHYTDTAGAKQGPAAEAARLGCDMSVYVGGHPMTEHRRLRTLDAHTGLFLGRAWVLCTGPETAADAVAAASALVRSCGAFPVVMDTAEHDRATALVRYAPQVVASVLAARFADAPQAFLDLAGRNVHAVVAAGDPEPRPDVLAANARPVADVLDAVVRDLARIAAALRGDAAAGVAEVLARGAAGRARVPGKRGAHADRYTVVPVLVPDRLGELALLVQAVEAAEINIEDMMIENLPGQQAGLVEVSVRAESAPALVRELRARRWTVLAGRETGGDPLPPLAVEASGT
ncbi:prephenate dehydrogenase [Spirillospora sp. NPDC000708]